MTDPIRNMTNEKKNIVVSLIQHLSEDEQIRHAQRVNNIVQVISRLDSLDYDVRQSAIANIHNELDSIFEEAITSLENQRTR